MTDRATIHQVVQLVKEVTPGTRPAGGANRRLQSISISPSIQKDIRILRPKGFKFPTQAAPGRDWVEAAIEGQADYNELTWLLASIFQTPTPAQQGSTDAYKHDFTIDSNSPDTITTYYVEEGGSVRAHAFAYGLVTELGMEITREECNLTGSMLGQRLVDAISSMGTNEVQTLTITGSPAGGTFTITFGGQTTAAIDYDATAAEVQAALVLLSTIGSGNVLCSGGPLPGTPVVIEFQGSKGGQSLALMTTTDSLTGGTDPESAIAQTIDGGEPAAMTEAPIIPEHISIYLDDTAAALGTTLLTRVLSLNWSLASRFGPIWPINRAKTSFDGHVETEPEGSVEMTMEADAVGMALLTAARAGTKKFLRIEAVGPTIEDAYTYKLIVDLCVVVSEPGEFSDEEGVYAIPWTFRIAHDSTWGKAVDIDLYNEVTAL
jgi:hypothetical protein